jgi:hypothetical protein
MAPSSHDGSSRSPWSLFLNGSRACGFRGVVAGWGAPCSRATSVTGWAVMLALVCRIASPPHPWPPVSSISGCPSRSCVSIHRHGAFVAANRVCTNCSSLPCQTSRANQPDMPSSAGVGMRPCAFMNATSTQFSLLQALELTHLVVIVVGATLHARFQFPPLRFREWTIHPSPTVSRRASGRRSETGCSPAARHETVRLQTAGWIAGRVVE